MAPPGTTGLMICMFSIYEPRGQKIPLGPLEQSYDQRCLLFLPNITTSKKSLAKDVIVELIKQKYLGSI